MSYEDIKSQLPAIETYFEGLRRESPTSMCGSCPICRQGDDRFVVRTDTGKCWSRDGCIPESKPWDVIDVAAWAEGVTTEQFIAAKLNGDESETDEKRTGQWQWVDEYNYTDENGGLRYQVRRAITPDGKKIFPQRRPDGNGGWIKGLGNVRKLPYRLPKICAADTVFIPEGEKDVHTLERLGLVASCNSGGAGNWSDDISPFFENKEVILIPDNDNPGRKHADKVAASLSGIAGIIRVLSLPNLPEKGDVTDWLENGGSKKLLKDLAENAEEWKPDRNFSNAFITNIKERRVKKSYIDNIGNEKWLYDNLIADGLITVIIAKPGHGKTSVLFFEVAPKMTAAGRDVIYIDADSGRNDHKLMFEFAEKNRFTWHNVSADNGINSKQIVKDLKKSVEEKSDFKKIVLIFDTLKKFIGNVMDKKSVAEFYNLMRDAVGLGATIILLGHANKYRSVSGSLIFEGVGDIQNDADVLIHFEKNRNTEDVIITTVTESDDDSTKTRGGMVPVSFRIDKNTRMVTRLASAITVPDFTRTDNSKANDDEILVAACRFLEKRPEGCTQTRIVDYVNAIVVGAGKNRIRKMIVAHATEFRKDDNEFALFEYKSSGKHALNYTLTELGIGYIHSKQE